MSCLNLIIQYVNDSRPARQAEYEHCVRANLANPCVKSIHNLQEHPGIVVPEEFARHPKFRRHDLNRWMTYADAFAYAGSALAGEVCCLINLDIVLDPAAPWAEMPEILKEPMVFCLTRHEIALDGTVWVDPIIESWAMANSQDAWVFKAPIPITNCDFRVGVMGCDNAIAHRIKESNFLPVNAARRFRIFHLDRVRGKSVANHEKIYLQERQGASLGDFPERSGQYLLPEIDRFNNIEELLAQMNIGRMAKYSLICDTINKFVRLHNLTDTAPENLSPKS